MRDERHEIFEVVLDDVLDERVVATRLTRARVRDDGSRMSDAPRAAAPAGKVEPYLPASTSLPELTVGVILLGCVLAAPPVA